MSSLNIIGTVGTNYILLNVAKNHPYRSQDDEQQHVPTDSALMEAPAMARL